MENKVIAKEYVDTHYIHKDLIRDIFVKYHLEYEENWVDSATYYKFYKEIAKLLEDK